MMDDKKLKSLRHYSPPPPSDKAKQQAMQAACDAFEASNKKEAQKKLIKDQGLSDAGRLIHSFHQKLWRLFMKKQLITASIVTGLFAISGTTYMWQKGAFSPNNQNKIVIAEKQNPSIDTLEIARVDDSILRNTKLKHAEDSFSQKMDLASKKSQAVASREIAQVDSAHLKMRMMSSESLKSADAAISQDRAITHVEPAITHLQQKISSTHPKSTKKSMRQQAISAQRKHSMQRTLSEEQGQHFSHYEGRDQFTNNAANSVKKTSEEPVSTFSVDVDTASYAFVRKSLNKGNLPQKNAVRVEELINYFDYQYSLPKYAAKAFKPTIAIYPSPWNKHNKLLHIGIKGHDIIPDKKPQSNLVFLLDVSGSMNQPDKLPLLKNAFRLLVENLHSEDIVSIVTYAGRAATVLQPTKVKDKLSILAALDQLQSGGSTAGAQAIKQAYALAEQNFVKKGVNRIILATDGDFNVGIRNREELKGFIERKRNSGIFLSVLGFGQGNYNDALMQALAQNGNGNAAYIDTLNEARKVLVDEASSTLFPIAKDVKIQIEFNPETVVEYRLIGYETRLLKREDFNNDKVDAGDIGAGHTVTAIYEITPAASAAQLIPELRYQKKTKRQSAEISSEYAFLKLRYKLPKQDNSKLIEATIDKDFLLEDISQASDDMRFAASVAAFGQLLKGSNYLGHFSYDDIISLANNARGDDPYGYRNEFVNLVRLAKSAKKM